MKILFIIVPIFIILVFVFMILEMVSPKFRGKLLSREVKSVKYMMDESKKDIESISNDMVDATQESIEKSSRAIRKGIIEDESIYCKHCGSKIDRDSKFCKKCGKEQ